MLRPPCRLQNDMIIYSTGIRLASVAKVIGQLSKWGKSNQASDCDGKSFWKQKISSVQTDLVTSKDFQARNSYAIRLTWVFCKRARGWSPDLQQDGHKAMMQIGILKPAADVYVKTYTYVNVNIYICIYTYIIIYTYVCLHENTRNGHIEQLAASCPDCLMLLPDHSPMPT